MVELSAVDMMFGTGASSAKSLERLYPPIEAALCSGINGFDTAPSYGTEDILSKVLKRAMKDNGISRENIFLQSKIDPLQMQDDRVEDNLIDLLKRMRLDYLDSLLVHWPVCEYMDRTWDTFVRLKERGLVRYIGICNVRSRQLRDIMNYPVKPDIIQIERHPLRVCSDEIEICKNNGWIVQAYSPLCKMCNGIKESVVLKEIAEKYGASVGQIVLRWHADTGVIPVFTSTKARRVKEYSEIKNFCLTDEEIKQINGLNTDYKMYLESLVCPGI